MSATRHENKRVARLEIARVAFGANPALADDRAFPRIRIGYASDSENWKIAHKGPYLENDA